VSMPKIKYTEGKAPTASSDPMQEESSDGAENAAMHDFPEEGEIGNSNTEVSANPAGSTTKTFHCPYCLKSYSRMSKKDPWQNSVRSRATVE